MGDYRRVPTATVTPGWLRVLRGERDIVKTHTDDLRTLDTYLIYLPTSVPCLDDVSVAPFILLETIPPKCK